MDQDPAPAVVPVARARRVAVIAVHGVADQAPGETVSAISDLLMNLQQNGRPAYDRVTTTAIQVPVRKLNAPERPADADTYAPSAVFAERAPALRKLGRDDASDEFMTSLLEDYEPSGPDETYHTTVVRMTRAADEDGRTHEVDVFEMYWADLSRLTQSAFRMFAELYQLLFHFASLGVHALTAAEASERRLGSDGVWAIWRVSQRTAARALTLGFPVANLVLVALLLALFAAWMPTSIVVPQSVGIVGVAIAGAVGVLAYRRRLGVFFAVVSIAILLSAGATGVLAWIYRWDLRLFPNMGDWPHRLFATEVLTVGAALIVYLMRKYEHHRPGALRVTAVVGATVGAVVLWRLSAPLFDHGFVVMTFGSGERTHLLVPTHQNTGPPFFQRPSVLRI